MALLANRNTPLEIDFSPAEMLHGWRLKDNLSFTSHDTPSKTVAKAVEKYRLRYKSNYDEKHSTKILNFSIDNRFETAWKIFEDSDSKIMPSVD
ncbi:hypothetical protein JTB14_037106 [Gonioctena quinquepunctata]|nr:hypothetical protein JTB14_037106 [Gonioctena quinquepunctata]